MVIANILFWVGVILLLIGGVNVIRVDGSMKRVIACLVLLFIGGISLYAGVDIKNGIPVEYTITEVTKLNNNIRVNLKSDGRTFPIYVPLSEEDKYVKGETIELTQKQIKEYQ